jgi:hypothetical protein
MKLFNLFDDEIPVDPIIEHYKKDIDMSLI